MIKKHNNSVQQQQQHTHTHTHPYSHTWDNNSTPTPTRTHTHENLSHSPLWHNGERGSEKMSYFHKTNSDYNFWFEFLEELLINN